MSELDIASILLKGEKQDFILNKKNFKMEAEAIMDKEEW